MTDLTRIRADLAHARNRHAQMQAGQRGVRNGADWRVGDDADGGAISGAGRAFGNQLAAVERDIARLEGEYVQAMLASWGAAAVIARMEAPPPTTVRLPPSDDDVRAKLRELLAAIPDDATVKSLKELIQ